MATQGAGNGYPRSWKWLPKGAGNGNPRSRNGTLHQKQGSYFKYGRYNYICTKVASTTIDSAFARHPNLPLPGPGNQALYLTQYAPWNRGVSNVEEVNNQGAREPLQTHWWKDVRDWVESNNAAAARRPAPVVVCPICSNHLAIACLPYPSPDDNNEMPNYNGAALNICGHILCVECY
ncbi:hypothetical protein B0T21DRAFT_449256 [Apiosordaria backusii]|uniref:RING-type domain-containing protein n=1 Tax=Apiosordaria backusii TaxID=314023 RepID=A0AA40EGE1_9PEZI|nr:hypothetical protein B0T21DRAFT_449256 [Apiosordaria backusii]